MKEITYDQPGSPDVLKVVDSEVPEPNDNQILIKVMVLELTDQTSFKERGIILPQKTIHQY